MGKYHKINIIIGLFFIFSVACFSVFGWLIEGKEESNPVVCADGRDIAADYVESFGWEIDRAPIEISLVKIPTEFGLVYEQYNQVQLRQGFDLLPFRGREAEKRVYKILNYPEQPDDGSVRADILICDGKIIGADICSVRLDGFLHGVNENGG